MPRSPAAQLRYYHRVAGAYFGRGSSQLTFWWERPAAHEQARSDALGPYYMTFQDKAQYPGPFDDRGIPLLDYHGTIGPQYNPIAIAQFGLAKYNAWQSGNRSDHRETFLRQADWLRFNLRKNHHGVPVWMHDFDWEYCEGLKAPWYSALAQGQGISCLTRAYAATGDKGYINAAWQAFESLRLDVAAGGVVVRTGDDRWLEEYLTDPPSMVLNGAIWASWGVHDLAVVTGDSEPARLFRQAAFSIERRLSQFDTGWWSTYDLRPQGLRCLASPFYHRLHIVQLGIMRMLTGRAAWRTRQELWAGYAARRSNRALALLHKAAFKALYY